MKISFQSAVNDVVFSNGGYFARPTYVHREEL